MYCSIYPLHLAWHTHTPGWQQGSLLTIVTIDHQPPGDVTGVTCPRVPPDSLTSLQNHFVTWLRPRLRGQVSGAGARAVVSWSELLHWPWMGTTLVIITALTTSTGNHFLNFTLPFTVHSLAAWIRRNAHCLCFELKGKYELLLVYYLFIYWTLVDWKVPDWMSGVPGVSMQQDQSFCFPVSDVGPALPESGDLSQHSGNCLMESLIS